MVRAEDFVRHDPRAAEAADLWAGGTVRAEDTVWAEDTDHRRLHLLRVRHTDPLLLHHLLRVMAGDTAEVTERRLRLPEAVTDAAGEAV